MAHVSFHRLAEQELLDAARYCDVESPGLGSAFLDAAERCVEAIVSHPLAGSPVRGVVRRRLLPQFPYALLYRAHGDGIRILAVMNLKRRPLYWVRRR